MAKYIERNGIVTVIDTEFKDVCDIHNKFEMVHMTRKDYNNGGQSTNLFLCMVALVRMRIISFDHINDLYLRKNE